MRGCSGAFEDKRFAGAMVDEVASGGMVAVCSILATRGSAPQHAGARMALLPNGSFIGTIGGGRIEQIGEERCRALMDAARCGTLEPCGIARLEWIDGAEIGMMCGGAALLSVRIVGADDLPVLQDLAFGRCAGGRLVEDWSHPDAPSWHVEPAAPRGSAADAVQAVWDESSGMYVEPLKAESFAYVFGAGHVASALVPVLASVGFRVVVVDDRPELAVPARFPDAERVVCSAFEAIADAVSVTERDYAVVMTHSHALDFEVLEHVLNCAPSYVGCIGSKGKTARFRRMLAQRGMPEEVIASAHMPIGDDIGAATPAEIAISIVAQMIRRRACACSPQG